MTWSNNHGKSVISNIRQEREFSAFWAKSGVLSGFMKKLAQFKCIRMGLRQNSGPPSLGIWASSDFAERAARRQWVWPLGPRDFDLCGLSFRLKRSAQ